MALRHLELIDEWDVLANVPARADQLAGLLAEHVAPLPGGRLRSAPAGSWWASSSTRPPTACAGDAGCAPGPCQRGVLLRPLGDVVVLMPMLTSTAAEIERIVAVLSAAVEAVTAGAAGPAGVAPA